MECANRINSTIARAKECKMSRASTSRDERLENLRSALSTEFDSDATDSIMAELTQGEWDHDSIVAEFCADGDGANRARAELLAWAMEDIWDFDRGYV